jgi:hypothetical protein
MTKQSASTLPVTAREIAQTFNSTIVFLLTPAKTTITANRFFVPASRSEWARTCAPVDYAISSDHRKKLVPFFLMLEVKEEEIRTRKICIVQQELESEAAREQISNYSLVSKNSVSINCLMFKFYTEVTWVNGHNKTNAQCSTHPLPCFRSSCHKRF